MWGGTSGLNWVFMPRIELKLCGHDTTRLSILFKQDLWAPWAYVCLEFLGPKSLLTLEEVCICLVLSFFSTLQQ